MLCEKAPTPLAAGARRELDVLVGLPAPDALYRAFVDAVQPGELAGAADVRPNGANLVVGESTIR